MSKAKLTSEGRRFFMQRMSVHIAAGKTAQEAVALAKADGQAKYGADWATIMEVLMTLLPIILALFKK